MGIITQVALAIVCSILATELLAWGPRLSKWLLGMAVARAPLELRERMREEWAAHLDEIPGGLSKLTAATGFLVSTSRITVSARKAETQGKAQAHELRGVEIDTQTSETPIAATPASAPSVSGIILPEMARVAEQTRALQLALGSWAKSSEMVRLAEQMRATQLALGSWAKSPEMVRLAEQMRAVQLALDSRAHSPEMVRFAERMRAAQLAIGGWAKEPYSNYDCDWVVEGSTDFVTLGAIA